jgi:uncharacterized protein Yka (UPF0111/DUF47 family)
MKKAHEYKLIPMFDITDEARKIAVAWMACEDKDWIGQKHKLASDIMNYAESYAHEREAKWRELYEAYKELEETLYGMKRGDELRHRITEIEKELNLQP